MGADAQVGLLALLSFGMEAALGVAAHLRATVAHKIGQRPLVKTSSSPSIGLDPAFHEQPKGRSWRRIRPGLHPCPWDLTRKPSGHLRPCRARHSRYAPQSFSVLSELPERASSFSKSAATAVTTWPWPSRLWASGVQDPFVESREPTPRAAAATAVARIGRHHAIIIIVRIMWGGWAHRGCRGCESWP